MAIFNYASGESVAPPSPEQAAIYGRELAKVHKLSTEFPRIRELPDRSYQYVVDQQETVLRTVSPPGKLKTYLWNVIDTSREKLASGQLTQGVISIDSHFGNNSFDENNNITFYDFDSLGFGYFLYDIATGLWSILSHDVTNYEELKIALIEVYQSVFPLKSEELDLLDHFIDVRNLDIFTFQVAFFNNNDDYDVTNEFLETYQNFVFDKILNYRKT